MPTEGKPPIHTRNARARARSGCTCVVSTSWREHGNGGDAAVRAVDLLFDTWLGSCRHEVGMLAEEPNDTVRDQQMLSRSSGFRAGNRRAWGSNGGTSNKNNVHSIF